MPHEYRSQSYPSYAGRLRRDDRRLRPGEDRDPYEVGDEQRYMSRPEGRRQERGFEGDRSYRASGYAEEFGYRNEARGSSRERDGDAAPLHWRDQDSEPGYFGTGVHYGGGYATAPGSRVSAAGSMGALGYAGESAWSDREDWLPESERSTSGDYANYGGSLYGSQAGYGREYGDSQRAPRQSFRGVGPKGYQRSDERLKEMICERLTDDPRIDASDVSVEVRQSAVKLTGTIPDRRTKYAIEDLIEQLGASDVDNRLRVQSHLGVGGAAPQSAADEKTTGSAKRA